MTHLKPSRGPSPLSSLTARLRPARPRAQHLPSGLGWQLQQRRSAAVARHYSDQLDAVDALLLLGTRASFHALAFARQFPHVVLFEDDDALCAQFRARIGSSGRIGKSASNIIVVDSKVEGEAIVRTLGERFAIIEAGTDVPSINEATETMRRAEYLVLQNSPSLPEVAEQVVEGLDETGKSREFNVANAWDEPPKFSDWQRRQQFRDRMAAQYRAYSIHARRMRKPQISGFSLS